MTAKPPIFKTIEKYAKLVQNLTIIFGIFGAAISLLNARHEKRVEKTVEFTKLYNSDVRKDYLALQSKWDAYVAEHPEVRGSSAANKDEFSRKFFDIPDNKKLGDNITDFFDTFGTCVKVRTCDRNTALDLFGRSVEITYEVQGPFIRTTREKDKDYGLGKGLEYLYYARSECALASYF